MVGEKVVHGSFRHEDLPIMHLVTVLRAVDEPGAAVSTSVEQLRVICVELRNVDKESIEPRHAEQELQVAFQREV
jgi:hypothetical protein